MGGFLVGNIFCNILKTAIQKSTDPVKGLGFRIFVGFQPPDGFAVDAADLPQLVSGYIFLLHNDPKLFKGNHFLTPILTQVIMGDIIFFIKGI